MANTATTAKKVKIKIPLTRENADDLYVAVNGKSFLIKRGETVEVPEYVAKVIENSEKMQALAIEYENSVKVED